jgi:TRAP-type C4-dicarboxylate transport system permease small subunit
MRRRLDAAIDFVLAALLVAMTAVVFIQVFFRYVLNAALPWPEETARILIVWLSFLGAYMAMRERKHIGFSVLVDKLPLRSRAVVNLIGRLLVIGFLAVVVKEGVRFVQEHVDIPMPYTDVSTGWVVYSVFPVAGALMLFQSLMDIAEAVRDLRPGGGGQKGSRG